jgi:hypothetical protein
MIDGRWIESHQRVSMLGEILVRMAVINEGQLKSALNLARDRGQLLGQTLVELDFASLPQIREALRQQRGMA